MLTLYGTVTSPYVRRVRMVALELGVPVELVNVADPDGQARLRTENPLWKVPAARLNDELLFDSTVINRRLMDLHGPGPLAPSPLSDVETLNRMTVTDGALDALINVFYLGKDGISASTSSYLQKQMERAAASLHWLEARVRGDLLSTADRFGLAEIGLLTALDWMDFRETYSVAIHPKLMAFRTSVASRPSARSTAPPIDG